MWSYASSVFIHYAIFNSIINIGVGVAYSIAGVKVKLSKNILIAFIAFIVSLAALFGQRISHYLNDTECINISMLLLILMGTNMIYTSFSKKK